MQLVFSLVAGLIIALALQLLLTNLGVALGLTVIGWAPQETDAAAESAAEASDASDTGASDRNLPITHLLGLGVALSFSTVIFAAALLTTEFSQISQPRRGLIFGIILWATSWLLLLWLSSTTLSSLADTVLGVAVKGVRRLVSALGQTLHSSPAIPATADRAMLRDLAASVAQVAEVQQQLPVLLRQQRDVLIAEISDRSDLSPDDAETVLADLESPTSDSNYPAVNSSGLLSQFDLPSWQQVLQQLLQRVDLSDLDLETLWQQWQSWQAEDPVHPDQSDPTEASHPTEPTLSPALGIIQQDAADYVRQAPAWSLQPERLKQEFQERIYDPEADPAQIKAQLAPLDRPQFVDWLQQRGDLAAETIDQVADQLCQVRTEVMTAVTSAPQEELQTNLETVDLAAVQERLLAYCRYTNLDLLTPEGLVEKVQTQFQEQGLSAKTYSSAVNQLDLTAIEAVLARRQGLSAEGQQTLLATLQSLGDQNSDRWPWNQAYETLTNYFQEIDWSAVSLEDVKPDVLDLLDKLEAGGNPLDLDWASLEERLSVPENLQSDLQDWLQVTGQRLSRPPRRWAERAGHSAQSLGQRLAHDLNHYWQYQAKDAFHPSQMAADLGHLLKDAWRSLPQPEDWPNPTDLADLVDTSTWREALEKRRDLTAEEIQQILDWGEAAWQQATQQLYSWIEAAGSAIRQWLETATHPLSSARQQVVDQIVAAQEQIQAQAAAAQADLQHRTDAARRQIAIAAWWLFFSLLASGSAAAIAGWLAVIY